MRRKEGDALFFIVGKAETRSEAGGISLDKNDDTRILAQLSRQCCTVVDVALDGRCGKYEYFAGSAIGYREVNEDNFLIECLDTDALLAVVADGMGGLEGGETASKYAVDAIAGKVRRSYDDGEIERLTSDGDDALCVFLENILRQVSNDLFIENAKMRRESGATVVMCLILRGKLYEVHCGDSRLLIGSQGGKIRFVTRDHSPVGALWARGKISEAESLIHPNRNLISSFVGEPRPMIKTSSDYFELSEDNVVLLCSDGVCGCLLNAELAEAITVLEPRKAFCELIYQSYRRGGTDNATVVIVKTTKKEM